MWIYRVQRTVAYLFVSLRSPAIIFMEFVDSRMLASAMHAASSDALILCCVHVRLFEL